jgi:flagellar hook protein FlgE
MSLYSAMLAGVSGLQANSSALAAISDNIANVNTIGYKNNTVEFESLVTNSTTGSTYSAGGVTTSNQQFVTQQGSPNQTSSPTDLAIAGQGMFVTSTAPTALNANSQVLFTRAGSFTTDSAGYLKNAAGLYLMGWAADAQGNISPANSLTSLSPINIDALSGAVSATSAASLSGNLDVAQTISSAATAAATTPPSTGAYDPTTNSMTAYDASATTPTGVKPDFTMQIPVSDSLGGQHTLQVDFLKSSTANQWDVEIQATPTSDIPGATPPGQIAYGTATFDPATGALTGISLTGSVTGTPTTTNASLDVNWAASLGVTSPQSIDLNLSGLTQYASASSVQQVITNGTTFGNLSSVSVDKAGYVTATFDNGTSRKIAQVAMATFPNEDGLQAVNGNAYQATAASGAYNLKTAGSGGAGTIASSALEASTVDLSSEFTNLIITQRAYTASSKIITTADQMTQDLLAIIR